MFLDEGAHHLLLRAHMADKALNALGKASQSRGRAGIHRATIGQFLPQPLEGDHDIAAPGPAIIGNRQIAAGGGKEILDLGVETVLGLTGLKIEKTEDKRA